VPQANDSVTVTPGAGATVATHLVNSKEYQVVMPARSDGYIVGSRDDWLVYYTPVTNANNREVAELYNADATAIVRVRGIWLMPTFTAITGVQIGFNINRITTVGTTGSTTVTPRPTDTTFTALDADITARYGSTAGAALDYTYFATYTFNEETNAAFGMLPLVNQLPLLGDQVMEIVLRQNQGVQVKQNVAATVGLTGAMIYFTVD
jgi:hypothetical protein